MSTSGVGRLNSPSGQVCNLNGFSSILLIFDVQVSQQRNSESVKMGKRELDGSTFSSLLF